MEVRRQEQQSFHHLTPTPTPHPTHHRRVHGRHARVQRRLHAGVHRRPHCARCHRLPARKPPAHAHAHAARKPSAHAAGRKAAPHAGRAHGGALLHVLALHGDDAVDGVKLQAHVGGGFLDWGGLGGFGSGLDCLRLRAGVNAARSHQHQKLGELADSSLPQ